LYPLLLTDSPCGPPGTFQNRNTRNRRFLFRLANKHRARISAGNRPPA
jgi:hypothetical protein